MYSEKGVIDCIWWGSDRFCVNKFYVQNIEGYQPDSSEIMI